MVPAEIKFQSLIGRLKTEGGAGGGGGLHLFQSLIGRLKTIAPTRRWWSR